MNIFHKLRKTEKISGGWSTPETDSVKEENDALNDICVVCGKDSGIPYDMPISHREGYIEGSGQLCRDCYFELYIKPNSNGTAIPNEYEMKRLLEMSRKGEIL